MKNLVKDTIHANGIDIGIYTQNFENEFISLTDIARYKSDEPKDVIKKLDEKQRHNRVSWFMGKTYIIVTLKGSNSTPLEIKQGFNAFTMSPTKWIERQLEQ